jgi:hypothetical protein
MARREPEHFEGIEPELAYVARKLRYATRVEALLTDAGVDYVVEVDAVAGGFLFRSERQAAYFYVAPTDLERAAAAIRKEGFSLEKR